MLNWLIGLLASVSSIFVNGANKPNMAPPLNTAIIAYQETYYVPVVADLENFPRAKRSMVTTDNQEIVVKKEVKVTPPAAPIPTPAPAPVAPLPLPAPALPPQDPYLAIPEPITPWLSMNLTLKGTSLEGDRTLPELAFDREYWRMEVFVYWAPDIIPPKPEIQNDYFKLEVYEKGTNKLIYTMTSGSNEMLHKFQAFRKPGTYYFKVYSKDPSEWEISFVVSPKIAQ